ncbi:MAG: TetR/AcrR family transcriptional regulator [Haloechinothrix sp.]
MARSRKHYTRREQLIDATLRTIAERGRDNVRVRDIAAEAGVSPGSVLYHYPELSELMFDAHRTVVERFYRRRVESVEARQAPADQLVAAIETGLPSGRRDEVARALYEMHRLADRSSAHAALMTSLFDREIGLYATILKVGQSGGEFTLARGVQELAGTLVVLEDGLGLHLLSNNTSVDLTQARRMMAGYAQQVTGCELPIG